MTSRLQDPAQKIMFGDEHWAMLAGGRAVAQVGREEADVDGLPATDDSVYLALSLRNAGSGLASVSLHHNVDRPDPREAPLSFYGPAV